MAIVLVVDDSRVDQLMAGARIEALGSTPIFAANGREALETLERDSADVVLTDLQMPEMDGLQLVEETRRRFPAVPVILMTAYGSEDIAVRALRAGASNYVPKRNLKQDLGEALRTVLATADAARQCRYVRDFLVESESRFELGYEPSAPQALIGYLQESLTRLNFCDQAVLYQMSVALTEAFNNAVEHGNLELDSALRESSDGAYHVLGRQRAEQPPYRDRRVHVCFRLTPSEAAYTVRDEGPGFDPNTLPDPTDPENLVKPSGRGVMLIHTFMDEVCYNAKGNELTMIKRRSSNALPPSAGVEPAT